MRCRLVHHCLLSGFICLMLTACLPGKQQEQKIMAAAETSAANVRTDHLAANLTIVAQHLANDAGKVQMARDIETLHCGTDVFAYVSGTSTFAKAGRLPLSTARFLTERLVAQMGSGKIISDAGFAQAYPACFAAAVSIAVNSPIVHLVNEKAAAKDGGGGTQIASVEMKSCRDKKGKKMAGVTVIKTLVNGTTTSENHCIAAPVIPEQRTVMIGMASMPDWSQTTSGGLPDAVINYSCFSTQADCSVEAPPTKELEIY